MINTKDRGRKISHQVAQEVEVPTTFLIQVIHSQEIILIQALTNKLDTTINYLQVHTKVFPDRSARADRVHQGNLDNIRLNTRTKLNIIHICNNMTNSQCLHST